MVAVILFLLLVFVIYFYFTGTVGHLFHSVRVTGRMLLIVLVVVFVLSMMTYYLVKFGNNF